MYYDVIVVGQGLCGTFLSYFLHREGLKVLVVDEYKPFSASQIASGVINPITGRRFVKTWKIEDLIPFCLDTYKELEDFLHIKMVAQQIEVLNCFPSQQMNVAFAKRLEDSVDNAYLRSASADAWGSYFNLPFGAGVISPAIYIHLKELLESWRNFLDKNKMLHSEKFQFQLLQNEGDTVIYDGIITSKVIFCDGVAGAENPYFEALPFALNKGEAVIAKIPDLPTNYIYKRNLSIVPWHPEAQLFWIGSTYEWHYQDNQPTQEFREKVISQLQEWLKLPFEIIDHWASIRPANTERRPFVGWHPQHPAIGILNGMGTKGCSLAPYFAQQMVTNMKYSMPIDLEADIARFREKISSPNNNEG